MRVLETGCEARGGRDVKTVVQEVRSPNSSGFFLTP